MNSFSDNENVFITQPLGKYYLDFTDTAKNWDGTFDKAGMRNKVIHEYFVVKLKILS